jgi:tetratricopeptide (TPR) repeat protein
MKIKAILSLMFLFIMFTLCYGMDTKWFEEQISKIQEKRFNEVEIFLNENELSLQKDPEYYVILLNYIVSKGNLSGVTIAKGEPQGDDLILYDKTGDAVGFLGYRDGYDKKLILDGVSKAQSALMYFKSRLDIRFGIVVAAKIIKRWDIVGDQLVETLKVSKEINNKWSWGSINSMGSNLKEFMIENIQSDIEKLFRIEDSIADDALLRISQTMITCYPDVIYGYANLGGLYLAKQEYDKADEYFRKALQIDPNDEIVKANVETLKKRRK